MTLAELRKKHIENGGYWFDKSHKRTSKTIGGLRKGGYLITRDIIDSWTEFKVWKVDEKSADIKHCKNFKNFEQAKDYIKEN